MAQRSYAMPKAEDHVQAPLACQKGDTLRIELPSIPSTGYNWELERMPDGVSFWSQGFRRRETADPEIVGAGGTDVFEFKLRGSPKGSIQLGLRRLWEDEPAVRSCFLTLVPDLSSTKE